MADVTAESVVWVLGSGFSKSLGGPLLDELFQPHRLELLRSAWWTLHKSEVEADRWSKLVERWKNLVDFYVSKIPPKTPTWGGKSKTTPKFFQNAEEFVELLQLAAESDESAQATVRAMYSGSDLKLENIAQHAEDAITYLAAVMHSFLVRRSPNNERWAPYRRWAETMQAHDRVITFNYDRVVETAAHAEERAASGQPVEELHSKETPWWLYKLHGSVDWAMAEGACVFGKHPDDVLLNRRMLPAIAIPGPAKRTHCTTLFSVLWVQAMEAMQKTGTIVFVGYRFPPTDNDAKRQLLEAIRDNEQPHLTVRIVLGPPKGDDVQRLEGMLRWSLRHRHDITTGPLPKVLPLNHPDWPGRKLGTFRIVHEPMWAEDFLAVFDRETLHEPPE